jgi:hydrogenase maturation protease
VARVIGVGNALRGDDVAGLLVARRVRELEGALDVVELEGDPSRLLEAWREADDVAVVDAVASGAKPGSVIRFDAAAGPLPLELASSSTHALGIGDAVELARALGRLPGRLVVYAIEGANFEVGSGASAAVRGAVDGVARSIVAELSNAATLTGGPPHPVGRPGSLATRARLVRSAGSSPAARRGRRGDRSGPGR